MNSPDSHVPGANMGPTWVLSAPDGPNVGPMNIAIKVVNWSTQDKAATNLQNFNFYKM